MIDLTFDPLSLSVNLIIKSVDLTIKYKTFLKVCDLQKHLALFEESFYKSAVENLKNAAYASNKEQAERYLTISLGHFQIAYENSINYDRILASLGIALCLTSLNDSANLRRYLDDTMRYTYLFKKDERTNVRNVSAALAFGKSLMFSQISDKPFTRSLLYRYHLENLFERESSLFYDIQRELSLYYYTLLNDQEKIDLICNIIKKFNDIKATLIKCYEATSESEMIRYIHAFNIDIDAISHARGAWRIHIDKSLEFISAINHWGNINQIDIQNISQCNSVVIDKLFSIMQLTNNVREWKI